ncbi:mucin-19-like [Protopterus annectens]|uniref:mucin-19-like n=1 Tax=Protopterus annectens TaxID=7888 RepID=UPI001CFA2D9C|nr:mucin-19-like [Protopterus annectens]
MNLKALLLFWAFCLVKGYTKTKTHIPAPIKSLTASANIGKCSTWGKGACLPFQGSSFHISSECKFVLVENCPNSENTFSVQVKRNISGMITEIYIYSDGVTATVKNNSIAVDNEIVKPPVNQRMIRIRNIGKNWIFKLSNDMFSLIWNKKDAVQVIFHQNINTCGLCGSMDSESDESIVLRQLKYAVRTNGENCLPQIYKPENRSAFEAGVEHCSHIKNYTSSCRTTAIDKIIKMCALEYSHSGEDKQSACPSFSEASRQCTGSANYSEVNAWRSDPDIQCDHPVCEGNLEYKECGSLSEPTCRQQESVKISNCVGACVCPEGLVRNDFVKNATCIPKSQCPCEFEGRIYPPGSKSISSPESCVCYEGKWKCETKDCPGRCKIEDGSNVFTFDGSHYTLKRKCTYYALVTSNSSVTVDLDECKTLPSKLCMQSVSLTTNEASPQSFKVMNNGTVLKDGSEITLPFYEGVMIARQSSFFIQMNALGLQAQIQTISERMQLYITLSKYGQAKTGGLCGTFNGKSSDDYLSLHNMTEQNPEIFAETWGTTACTDLPVNPPSNSLQNEEYAKYCGLLKDPNGIFGSCHYSVDITTYYENCKSSTSNSDKPKESLCNALGNYAKACTFERESIGDWRKGICEVECQNNMIFKYNMSACNQTCRSRTQFDPVCSFETDPVEGCGCPEGMLTNLKGVCVPEEECECYNQSYVILAGNSYAINGSICVCEKGELICTAGQPTEECYNGTKYMDCRNSDFITERTCSVWSITAVKACKPGCYCPEPMARFGDVCVPFEECPCLYAGNIYATGKKIKRQCNTCICSKGTWTCTTNECSSTCHVFGNGRYVTFDEKRYSYNGDCENILVEDYCGKDTGTFRISTEGVPCCQSDAVCSRITKVAIKDKILILKDGHFTVDTVSDSCENITAEYIIHSMGLNNVIVLKGGVKIIFDKHAHTSVVLEPNWKGKVCGLCGNNNGINKDDFTTRDNQKVADAFIFGNSWVSQESECSAEKPQIFQCENNPLCKPLAEKLCSIIKDSVFKECHSKVPYQSYYDECIEEACVCDMEGSNARFCTSVAMYADACISENVCIEWRTPNICPVWCDYYNEPDECSWHYEPCGRSELQTCSGHPLNKTFSTVLEGCYPKCPDYAPYLDENRMKCVSLSECSCFLDGVILLAGEKVKSAEDNCYVTCACIDGAIICQPNESMDSKNMSDYQQMQQDYQQMQQDQSYDFNNNYDW